MTSGPMNSGCVLAGWACVTLLTAMPVSAGFPAKNVALYAHLSVQDFDAKFAEDCWGYVSPSGREYAIIGLSTGTGFVEITNPANPAIIDVVLTPNQGRDMKVFGHYVYSSSDAGPFHIIDVQEIDNGVVTLVNTIQGGTHNIAINEQSGFLYACGGGAMVVLSLADPVNPELVAIWEGQAHDAQVVTYTDGPYAGREIAFVFAGSSHNVDIVDVTDKSDMFLVGSTTYPDAGYTHQGWLSGDRRYLYVSDELDDIQRTTILDVSDLSNPFPVGEFTTGLLSTDHNLYVRDGFVFEANYTSGVRVFDACDPVNPVEVGFFDTYPANNDPGFSGAWSSYPFFPSGTVIVSDRSGGLFILDASAAVGVGCSSGDLDGDGDVDIFDLLLLLSDWGVCQVPPDGCPADLDGDGTVGVLDLLILLANWG